MSNKPVNDGGPAFPTENEHIKGPGIKQLTGMSLRDWFAGQALTGIMSAVVSVELTGSGQIPPDDVIAGWAYVTADAMLAARAK